MSEPRTRPSVHEAGWYGKTHSLQPRHGTHGRVNRIDAERGFSQCRVDHSLHAEMRADTGRTIWWLAAILIVRTPARRSAAPSVRCHPVVMSWHADTTPTVLFQVAPARGPVGHKGDRPTCGCRPPPHSPELVQVSP
jgi:hypothetical protein